jgi:hypothetical protein
MGAGGEMAKKPRRMSGKMKNGIGENKSDIIAKISENGGNNGGMAIAKMAWQSIMAK